MTYIFGPILSRRLGRSLGIDLLPPKTCSMNCVYCECGVTTELSNERSEWVPTEAVIAELDAVLATHPALDFITFSGAGEPTLHSGIGKIIDHIRALDTGVKICLLTNGSTLGSPGVSESLRGLDRIVPSLDAVTESVFEAVNRPAPGVTAANILSGICHFRKVCPQTEMALEIFIVPGLNDSETEITAFAEAVRLINPNKVQLNSLDRPGCEEWIQRPNMESAEKFRNALSGICPVEMVGKIDFDAIDAFQQDRPAGTLKNRILTTCLRRPCTLEDLTGLIGMDAGLISETLRALADNGFLTTTAQDDRLFYRTVKS